LPHPASTTWIICGDPRSICVHLRVHSLLPEPPRITEVAAAVIEKPDGQFLLAQRPAGKPYAGYWEFPGGKIEAGEDPRTALARELREELGIELREAFPWITRTYAYTHATVRLHFFRVTRWDHEPRPLEDQDIRWQRVESTDVSPMLPANAPVLAALALPRVMIVSDAASMGIEDWVRALEERAQREPLLVQVREKEMGFHPLQHLVSRTLVRTSPWRSRVVVNSSCHRLAQCDGLHLTAAALMAASSRPAGALVGASCHDEAELDQAAALGVDYAVLGPVKATPSHPGAQPLGWSRFEALAKARPMPLFAIGGLTRADLEEAARHGAHGVALKGAAFR
jgi:8-oxo-dGTP diphosphatase